jgi:uncharacterized protein YgbK (DUF1537 family)
VNGKRRRIVVVLDDDPTGTQCAQDVPVLLEPRTDPEPLLRDVNSCYVLTNSRALPAEQAVELLRDIRTRMNAAAGRINADVEYILRGDSTLRGHVFAESDAFGAGEGVLLFVPAFPAAGRVTLGGVHYVSVGGSRVPAHETEFAGDPVFGYSARTMVDWVREQGSRPGVAPGLGVVRGADGELVRLLVAAEPGTVVAPDAETDADLERISAALSAARAAGKQVVLRCAAPLAALRADRRAGDLLASPVVRRPGATLVVCGSHTQASTLQLKELARALKVPVRIVSTGPALADPARVGAFYADVLAADLDRNGVAIVASERDRQAEHDSFEHGARVMRALCAAISPLRGRFTAMIAKGGITSADVARHGLGVRSGHVRGPVLTGVSVWDLTAAGGADITYAVVPGNVGEPRTLVRVAEAFGLLNAGAGAGLGASGR